VINVVNFELDDSNVIFLNHAAASNLEEYFTPPTLAMISSDNGTGNVPFEPNHSTCYNLRKFSLFHLYLALQPLRCPNSLAHSLPSQFLTVALS
jgi:hypothetical protein